jgi:hypothetical protein
MEHAAVSFLLDGAGKWLLYAGRVNDVHPAIARRWNCIDMSPAWRYAATHRDSREA